MEIGQKKLAAIVSALEAYMRLPVAAKAEADNPHQEESFVRKNNNHHNALSDWQKVFHPAYNIYRSGRTYVRVLLNK